MKREIKFRCWDEFNSEMLYPNKSGMFIGSGGYSLATVCNYANGTIPMQFIGDTDIIGHDIYEGDILCDNLTKLMYVVKFVSAGFYAFRVDEGIKNYPINLNSHDINLYHLQVIGNICENADLLKLTTSSPTEA